MVDPALLEGMRSAVEADGSNVALRLHYAELLAASFAPRYPPRQLPAQPKGKGMPNPGPISLR
jgi:hypothetical protein